MNVTVTGATNVSSTLTIEAGVSVALDNDTNLNAGNHILVDGTLDKAGVLRTGGAKLDVSGSLGSSITFLDTDFSS